MRFKRAFLALLLSLSMIVTFMPTIAFAEGDEGGEDPNQIEEQYKGSFTFANGEEAFTLVEGRNGNLINEDIPDEGEFEYFNYWMPEFSEGDTFTLINASDGTETEYVYSCDEGEWGFYDTNGNRVYAYYGSNQAYNNQWVVDPEEPFDYHFTVTFEVDGDPGVSVTVNIPAVVVADDVVNVEFETADGSEMITLAENTRGEMITGADPEYFQYVYDPSSEGDKIYVTYSDGSEDEYIYSEDYEGYVNTKDSEDILGGDDVVWGSNQDTVHWVPDRPDNTSYCYTMSFKGYKEVIIPVTIAAGDISSIEYIRSGDDQTINYVEGIDSYIRSEYRYDDEDEEEVVKFTAYPSPDFNKGDQLKITNKDGSVITYTCNDDSQFIHDKDVINTWSNFDWVAVPAQTYDNPWVAGGTYGFALEYKGVRSNIIEVNILENPYTGITFTRGGDNAGKPYELIEGTDGYYDSDNGYYRYSFPGFVSGDKLRVSKKDGNTTYVYGTYTDKYGDRELGFINEDDPTDVISGEAFEGGINSDQSGNNQWKAGETHEFVIRYAGKEATLPVTIIESPVAEVSFSRPGSESPYTLVEGRDGWYSSDEEDYGSTPVFSYRFEFKEGDVFTITRKDDTSTNYVAVKDRDGDVERFVNAEDASDFIYEDEIEISSDQTYDEPWSVDGEGHSFDISYQSCHTTVEVDLQETPFESLTFIPADGKNKFTYIEGVDYYYPHFSKGDKIKLAASDGTEITYTYDWDLEDEGIWFIDEDGNRAHLYSTRYGDEWNAGGEEIGFSLFLNGVTGKFSAEIIENNVESVVFNIGTHDPYTYYYPEGEGYHYFGYPSFLAGDSLTVKYTGGSTVKYTYDEELEALVNGDDILSDEYISFDSDQWSNEEGWGVGNHEFTVFYMGIEAENKLPVQVQTVGGTTEATVTSIAMEPIADFVLVEGKDGEWWRDGYGDPQWTYYSPSFRYGDKLLVTFEGSNEAEEYEYKTSSAEDRGTFVNTDDPSKSIPYWGVDLYADQDDNAWQPGNHELTLAYAGKTASVPVKVITSEQAGAVHEYVPTVPASCETTGMQPHWKDKDGNCYLQAEGGEPYTESLVIPATGHQQTPLHIAAKAATCDKAGNEECWRCEDCGNYFSDRDCINKIDGPVAIPKTGHNWGPAEYTWSNDNSSVIAVAYCTNDGCNKAKSETAHASIGECEATCTEGGEITYKAEFKSDDFETQEKTVQVEAGLGHSYGEPEYTWAEDYSNVTASMACTREGCEEVVKESVNTTPKVLKEPTCTSRGKTEYTSGEFNNEAFEVQVKTVRSGAAKGHDWSEWVEYKEGTCSSVGKKMRTCKNNPLHMEFADSSYGSHAWDKEGAEYEWSDDLSEVTVSVYCTGTCWYSTEGYTDSTQDISGEVTKEATAEEDGVMTFTATFHGEFEETTTKEVSFSDLPYEYCQCEYVEEVPATCTEDGVLAHYKSNICDRVFNLDQNEVTLDDLKIPAEGHGNLIAHEEEAASCEAAGTEAYWECENCGRLFSDDQGLDEIDAPIEIQAKGHGDLIAHEKVEASCDVAGTEAYWECGRCHWLFSDEECENKIDEPVEIPAGHDWGEPTYEWSADNSSVTATRVCKRDENHVQTETVNTTSEVTKPATCEEKGQKTFTSGEFENDAFEVQTKAVDINKLEHNMTHHEAVAATCEEDGTFEYWSCSKCNKNYNDEDGTKVLETTVDPKKGHDWGDPTYEWSADNSSVTATRVCKRDENHVQTEAVNTTSEDTKPATCEEKGQKTFTSGEFENDAFEVQTKTVDIDKLDHNMTRHEAVDPTCTTAGNTAYWSCSKCKKFFGDADGNTEIEEGSWVVNAEGHEMTAHEAVDPTCTTAGNTAYWSCSKCKKFFGDAEGNTEIEEGSWVVNAEGHELTHHDADPVACTLEYWHCSRCEKNFKDKDGTQELEDITDTALKTAKDNALAELDKIDLSKYSGAERTNVENAIKAAKEQIRNASTVDAVTTAKETASETISAQKTDETKQEEAKKSEEDGTKKPAAENKAKALETASNINKATVSVADIKKASALGATSITLGTKVKKLKKNAFKGTKIKTVVVKSKKLKKASVKGSLKGSAVKTIKVKVGSKKVNKQYVKKYKKIFTKKNAGKKVKVS